MSGLGPSVLPEPASPATRRCPGFSDSVLPVSFQLKAVGQGLQGTWAPQGLPGAWNLRKASISIPNTASSFPTSSYHISVQQDPATSSSEQHTDSQAEYLPPHASPSALRGSWNLRATGMQALGLDLSYAVTSLQSQHLLTWLPHLLLGEWKQLSTPSLSGLPHTGASFLLPAQSHPPPHPEGSRGSSGTTAQFPLLISPS